MATHPSFFDEAHFLLNQWKSAEERLEALRGPYNALADKVAAAKKSRVAQTAATGQLAPSTGSEDAAELETLEKARAELDKTLGMWMRTFRAKVIEATAPATSYLAR